MDLVSSHAEAGGFTGSVTSREEPAPRLRLAVYVAHGRRNVPRVWIESLQRFCGKDVMVMTHATATSQASMNPESAPFLDLARAIEARLFADRGRSAPASLVVLASHAIPPRPSNPRLAVPRRGGLAPGVKRRVCEHIDRELARPVMLGDLAAIAGLSAYHFARAFKQSVGVPPYRYVVRRRIAAAAELLQNTNNPLSAIAIDVGFSDQSHFTRLFVRHVGETPSAFRRRHR